MTGIRLISSLAAALLFVAAQCAQGEDMALKHSEIVFMYASTDEAYKAYGATFVAWGGANTAEEVRRHHELGIRCTGSMWCLTAGAELIHKDPQIRNACAVDIEGRPVEVPWLFDHTFEGTKSYFGCTNTPAFRDLCARRVRECMKGGADGLHVDDHLGVAAAAWFFGGGFCDNCAAAFREYLKENARPEELAKAGVTDLGAFDYRDLVRRYASTREQYKKVQHNIPLMNRFLEFHATAAAEHVRRLGEVAAEAAGRPVLLSANACLPNKAHTYVIKYLTHIVCEVSQNAGAGASDIAHAVEAYELASKLGKPMAATASGWDWALVKERNLETLPCFWIALAYAHGQRFMVPHPTMQWCFTEKLGTHWYKAPVEAYAPMYRFIRANADCFDGFESALASGLRAPEKVLVTARKDPSSGALVLHVINRDYDSAADSMRPIRNAVLEVPDDILPPAALKARVLSYDSDPEEITLTREKEGCRITLPEIRLWSFVVIR